MINGHFVSLLNKWEITFLLLSILSYAMLFYVDMK
jgi:hypothetical protein